MARPRQSIRDRILWTLVIHDGIARASILSSRLGMKLPELERILQDLEQEGLITRMFFIIGNRWPMWEWILLSDVP